MQETAYNPRETDVRQMFNDIAPKYDFLNHFLSARSDKRWRRKTIKKLRAFHPKHILDIATGTGDLAIECTSLNPEKIVGTDISEKMLRIAERKIKKRKLNNVCFQIAAAENLPFNDASFDAITVGFGVRNFYDLQNGLREMFRVLRIGGVTAILEFSLPSSFPMKQLYMLYFRRILPFIGRIVSKSKTAYIYLPKTVISFPQGKEFMKILSDIGFSKVSSVRLSGGICSIYIAVK